jgi:tetratricopeptide (TPR) repeat protein/ferredoxin
MRPMSSENAPRAGSGAKHCETRHPAVALSLPVIAGGGSGEHAPKGSRAPHSGMGWRRATVLIVIQLLMVAHVVQWLWTGSTIKPIEPSETMETTKDGIITVGTIFFVLALASTAVLGRWFCGWGCHVVMLQDFCGYLMKRAGIRPRLFRSRLLLWLPLALATYMFLWPVVYRFAIAPFTRPELRWPGFSASLVTNEFWATFPGVAIAVPFLLVCGFLTVYLLGAKGYCTYACPYGGFFAPLDELAPVRIRVSDACTQCGHCTAVCTSNVRVHEEVRDFRMVVDQGCMKCLDCVSACPEQALRVGWGAPAFMAKRASDAPARPSKWDLSWNAELALAAVAIASFFAVRGAIGVPLLFASGIAVCATYLAWMLAQIVTAPDVRLHRMQLKRAGRATGQGIAVALVALAALAAVAGIGAINTLFALAENDEARVTASAQVVLSGAGTKVDQANLALASRARARYEHALAWSETVGIAAPIRQGVESRIAWLDAVAGDFKHGEQLLRAAAARDGMNEGLAIGIARLIRGSGDAQGGNAFARAQYEANPAWHGLREELVGWLLIDESRAEALAITRSAIARDPSDVGAQRRLSAILVESLDPEQVREGIALIDRLLQSDPNNAPALAARARGQQTLGDIAGAEASLRRAIEIAPDDWKPHQSLGMLLMATDRQKEAASILKHAGDLRVKR